MSGLIITRSRQSRRICNSDQASSRLLFDNQLDWCQPHFADAPVTPIDEGAFQANHAASMTILEYLGVLFLNDAALSIFESHGCQVDWDSKRVRMNPAWVMEQVAKAPSHITVTPRNPDRTLILGGRYFNLG